MGYGKSSKKTFDIQAHKCHREIHPRVKNTFWYLKLKTRL